MLTKCYGEERGIDEVGNSPKAQAQSIETEGQRKPRRDENVALEILCIIRERWASEIFFEGLEIKDTHFHMREYIEVAHERYGMAGAHLLIDGSGKALRPKERGRVRRRSA